MPTIYTGAQIERRSVPMWALFSIQEEIKDEIQHRAWAYLRTIGYKLYRTDSMSCQISKRGETQLIRISAKFQEIWLPMSVDIEVPYDLFEASVPEEPVRSTAPSRYPDGSFILPGEPNVSSTPEAQPLNTDSGAAQELANDEQLGRAGADE